jgi:predicted transcriptional regulator
MKMKLTKKQIYEMYKKGISVKALAKRIGKSESSVYRYLNEMREKYRFPELKQEIKEVLLCGDFEKFIRNLDYSDICLLRRELNLYGYNKKEKVNSILKYFESYSILGIYPDNLTHSIIKKAYFRKARETHPDLNGNDGSEFKEVKKAYTKLQEKVLA